MQAGLTLRQARFHHAINYRDFAEYAAANSAVLSRSALSRRTGEFTRFFSDQQDVKLGVWDRSFGNLNDLGRYFWNLDQDAVPNAYGPITIVLGTPCWNTLADVRLTRYTATSADPGPIVADELDDVFELVDDVYRLRQGFSAVEVSCSNQAVPYDNLAFILVDPIEVGGMLLRDHVARCLKNAGLLNEVVTEKQVIQRNAYGSAWVELTPLLLGWARILAGGLLDGVGSLAATVPGELKEWYYGLSPVRSRALASWLTYTYNGTLRWLER